MTTTVQPGETLLGARRRLDRRLQAGHAGAQQGQGARRGAVGAAQLGLADSPFLTLEEAARYLRFDACAFPVRACLKFLVRQAVPVVRRGRAVLVERRVLESFVLLSKG